MNALERNLAAEMLQLARQYFGNHGCNDVSDKVWEGWSIEQRRQFVKEYHQYNGDPEEYDPNFLHLPDYAIMGFLAYKLKDDTK